MSETKENIPEFKEFGKISRLSRPCIITEKIDGTNAQIMITEEGHIFFGSRSRWVTPSEDNHGFAGWGMEHQEELLKLGPGRHYGEWWGRGINRNYGIKDRRLSLFNVQRWCLHGTTPERISCPDSRVEKYQDILPECVGLVPVLWRGEFSTGRASDAVVVLGSFGSKAAPGFMKPEGIVIYHIAANVGFKKTIEKDDQPKGK